MKLVLFDDNQLKLLRFIKVEKYEKMIKDDDDDN
jgi:hypothetical protein